MATSYYLLLLSADEIELHPPYYPWSHSGMIDSLDHSRYPMMMTFRCITMLLSAILERCFIVIVLAVFLYFPFIRHTVCRVLLALVLYAEVHASYNWPVQLLNNYFVVLHTSVHVRPPLRYSWAEPLL